MNTHPLPFPAAHFVFLRRFLLVLGCFLLPVCALADLFENFDASTSVPAGWIDGGTENDTLASHLQSAPNCRALGSGDTLQTPQIDFPTNLSFFVDASGGGNGQTATVEYNVEGGTWQALGSFSVSTGGGTESYSLDSSPNLSASEDVRFRFNSSFNTWYLDDVSVTVMSGPPEDPNLSTANSLSFGPLVPGTSETQTLSIANSGASNTLTLSSFAATSGDTGRFSVGTIPATLAPGASTNIPIVYTPGMNTGVYHSAIYTLNTDDPSTPAYAITLSGQTIGASLTVADIQGTSSTSPENGKQVRVTGIATYADPDGYALSDPDGGPWSGVYVTDVNHRPEIGDKVLLEAWVAESGNMTILNTVSDYQTLGSGFSVPATTITSSQLSTEAYEGVYVRVEDVTVNNVNIGGEFWQVTDGTSFRVGTRVPYRYIWGMGDTLDAVQGIVYVDGSTISIQPRNDWDLIGRPVYEYALRGMVMTPNGPLTKGDVHVEDDLIMAVTNVQPSGVTLLDTEGIIFPGLIDAHNHPSWNSFPTLMFNDFPFGHRDEWAATSEYSAWKGKRSTVQNHGAVNDRNRQTISKYAEALELMAGCIAIQGNYDNPEYAHPDIMLFNVEEFPGRVWADIFPWKTSSNERATLSEKVEGGALNALIIHLCEGVDAHARAQFALWKGWGMLDETTTIIHGAALNASDFAEMAAVNAKLVWSPMSNMKLYGGTADVKAAKEAGVIIGLSPDWTASGCYNILEELGYAWILNQSLFDNVFTAREMAEMVYLNTALCAGLGNHYGKINVGYNAGFCVIDGDTSAPYMALINARPADVLLTIVDGTPRYGDPAMMDALGASGEAVTISGVNKRFNIAVDHPFLDYGDTTFAELRSALQSAHATLTTTAVLNADELQFLDLALLHGSGGDDVAPFRADSPISSAPSTSVTYDQGSGLSLRFRYEDFWDNETYITDLSHTISIAPAAYPQYRLQTIATDRANTPANENVSFTVDFQDMHTNYVFVFETADERGNIRTTVSTNTFKLTAHTGGDTDGDGMPNEWEIQYFGGFANASATGHGDADWMNNLQEYIAGTLPTSAASVLSEGIGNAVFAGAGVCEFDSPVPTSPDRRYDVWWATNLVGPITWQAVGLDVSGQAGGGAVTLRITNNFPFAIFRTGVKLP
ncbi:MAG: amidohydrolase family protein [Kiritimatiellae bacterium]|nr:amidohydrolase family protein [Kiritimatiellia bacterium]